MEEKTYFVYILASRKYGTLYIGVTSELFDRIRQHKFQEMPGFTKTYGVTRLVYFERFGEPIMAITREKQLKRWRREWKINLIERDNPNWDDLAQGWDSEDATMD